MGIFSVESKLTLFLNRLGDLILVNLLALVCMVPVVTAGAAFTSLYEVTLKMVKNEEGPVVTSFLRAFRGNLKKSTAIWLIGCGIAGFLAADILLLGTLNDKWIMYYKIVLFILAVVIMMFTLFSLITAARFENTLKNTVRNGVLFCLIHFIKSILMFLVICLPVILVCISPRLWCVVILFGVSGPAYITSFYFRSLFRNYE